MDIKGVELFRTGRWNDIKTFTEDDLDAMVDSFDVLRLSGRTPLKLGHNDEQPLTDGQPALGWVQRVYRVGEKLLADFTAMPRAVYDAIKAGLYKHVSVELMRDVAAGNKEYPWVLSAVALLGADIPAVSGLRDLQQLTMARRATFPSGTRMTFTVSKDGGRETMDEAKKLQAEVDRLNALLVAQAQDSAITSRRCVPAERARFDKRYAGKGTLADWQDWLKDAQRPPAHMFREGQHRTTAHSDARESMADGRPDAEVVALTEAEVEKSGGKLTYFAAQQKVLRTNPELAERYRFMPGNVGD